MSELRVQIPAKMRPFLEPHRHKVAHGGRGGGKSHSIAQLLLVRGYQQPIRWLCTREVQKSIKDSVHRLLSDKIKTLGLSGFYEVTERAIRGANGTEFLFAGLRDHTVESIKSFEGLNGAWVEEAHKVTARSANILIPTIREPGSEIWWSYNPDLDSDYVHKRFVVQGDEQAVVVEINWPDNPWFPDVLNTERLHIKALNDDLYQHIWEGKLRTVAGILFKRHWFKRYELGQHPANLNAYMASDYAGAPDPDNPEAEPDWTEHGAFGLDAVGDMWFIDWWSGQEDPSVWIKAALAMVKRNKPLRWFEEKGVILRTVDGSINKAMRASGSFTKREPLASAGSKADRALGFAARAAEGSVWIPRCEWGDRFVNQLCAFTGQDGRVDDMVDVGSLAARGLDYMSDAPPEDQPKKAPPAPFTEEWFALRDRQAADREREAEEYYR